MLTLREIWNQAAGMSFNEKEFKPRNYVYASELGGSIYDVWHKVKGIVPTTPPNERSRRKFNAGHVWEAFVKLTLWKAGVLKEDQRRVFREPQGDLLGISGRIDFILAPGQPRLEDIDFLPDFFKHIVKQFESRTFEPCIMEVKSVSSMMFPKREIAPAENHVLQAGFYGSELGMPVVITYVSKDDCLLAEHEVDMEAARKEIDKWLAQISWYISMGEPPDKEKLLIKEGKRWTKNWRVEYSSYLTHYGFNTPEEYRDEVDGKVARFNRVLKRQAEGAKMTDDNLLALEEMKQYEI